MEVYDVKLSERAKGELKTVPAHISFKLQVWIDGVKNEGLSEMRKRRGYHDEPLKGKRKGQRSIRLNRSYRAIYELDTGGMIHFVEVIEVNKHDY